MNELILLTLSQEGAPAEPGGLSFVLPMIMLFVIWYFLLIRPQKKKDQARKEVLSRLKKGDSVVTSGGILGAIFALTDDEVVLEVADKTKLRVMRSQIYPYKHDVIVDEKDK